MPITLTLDEGINDSVTTILVTNGILLGSTFPYYISIDIEILKVTSIVATNQLNVYALTVVRGQNNTSAAVHDAEENVTKINIALIATSQDKINYVFQLKNAFATQIGILNNLDTDINNLNNAYKGARQAYLTLNEAANLLEAEAIFQTQNDLNIHGSLTQNTIDLIALAEQKRELATNFATNTLSPTETALNDAKSEYETLYAETITKKSEIVIAINEASQVLLDDIFTLITVSGFVASVQSLYEAIIILTQIFLQLKLPTVPNYNKLTIDLNMGSFRDGPILGAFNVMPTSYLQPLQLKLTPQASFATGDSGGARLGERVPLAPPP